MGMEKKKLQVKHDQYHVHFQKNIFRMNMCKAPFDINYVNLRVSLFIYQLLFSLSHVLVSCLFPKKETYNQVPATNDIPSHYNTLGLNFPPMGGHGKFKYMKQVNGFGALTQCQPSDQLSSRAQQSRVTYLHPFVLFWQNKPNKSHLQIKSLIRSVGKSKKNEDAALIYIQNHLPSLVGLIHL